MKRLSLVVAVMMVFAAMALSASGSAEGEEERVIAVVPQQLGNPIFFDAKAGAEEAGEDLGVKIEWVAPVDADASAQVSVVEGLIEKQVDGIAISTNDPDALEATLRRAIEVGIEVSTFDADSPDSGRAFYAGTENYTAGRVAGEHLIELTDGEARVALLTGLVGAYDMQARLEGFEDAIEGTNIEIAQLLACDDEIDKAVELVEQYTRSNPDIDAWFFLGGWPFFVPPSSLPTLQEWKTSNKTLVTIDTFYPMLDYFDEEMIDVAIGQDFYAMGYKSVENLVRLLDGEEIEGEYIDTGIEIVTPENYESVRAEKEPWD
ncbi:MAG: sugar-binding protein [Balneolaceae bacterium]